MSLENIRKRLEAATPAPWWYDEDEQCWRLHGTAITIPAIGPIGPQRIGKQIAKARKQDDQMMPYWPDPADAELIAHAPTDLKLLLAIAQAAAAFVTAHETAAVADDEYDKRWECLKSAVMSATDNDPGEL